MAMLRVELQFRSSSLKDLKTTFVVRKHNTRRHARCMRMSFDRFEYGIIHARVRGANLKQKTIPSCNDLN